MRAVLQLSHGMVEFIDRYKPLAENLAARGILVTGNDHLGHGGSIRTKEDYGYFGEPDGNRAVLEDLHAVTTLTKQLYPGVPYFLLGHSMARSTRGSTSVSGAMSWTVPSSWHRLPAQSAGAAGQDHLPGAGRVPWLALPQQTGGQTFVSGVQQGAGGRTAHDWLNRDPVEVDRYRADERCTFIFTLNAYYSMFSGILRLYDPALLARVPKDLPLLFLAGDADPVGEQGAGVKRAVKSLLDAGVKNIEVKLYPSARHELLVELNREEVFADIGDWLERRL